jgi:enterochelin esterase family protein
MSLFLIARNLISALTAVQVAATVSPTAVRPLVRDLALRRSASCDTITSHRIARLCAESANNPGIEAAFRTEIDGHAPLQELIPPRNVGDEWVTFVWFGNDSTTDVELDAPLPPLGNARYSQGTRPLNLLRGTHVWYRTERLPLDFRLAYSFQVAAGSGAGTRNAVQPDLLNHGESFEGGSIAAGFLAPSQPWLTRLAGVPEGALRRDSLFSRVLAQERTFTVYHPQRTVRAADAAFVVVLDGERYAVELPTPVVLDNLIAKREMRPAIVVFVDTRRWDRQADLACNRHFADFLVRELVPVVRRATGLTPTSRQSVLAGSSLGGLQSACTAFWYPSTFGNVLSMSGSYFWYPMWPLHEAGLSDQTGWVTSLVAHAPLKPLRWFVATGTFEGDGVPENRRFRDVLIAKGYPLTYLEYSAGHDEVVWREVIADGLLNLLPARAR